MKLMILGIFLVIVGLGCCTVTSCFQRNSSTLHHKAQSQDLAVTAHDICPRCDEEITWHVVDGYVGIIAEYTCDGFVHPECNGKGK